MVNYGKKKSKLLDLSVPFHNYVPRIISTVNLNNFNTRGAYIQTDSGTSAIYSSSVGDSTIKGGKVRCGSSSRNAGRSLLRDGRGTESVAEIEEEDLEGRGREDTRSGPRNSSQPYITKRLGNNRREENGSGEGKGEGSQGRPRPASVARFDV